MLLCHPICRLSATLKKGDVLDSIDDDDDIELSDNPFETLYELLAMIRLEGSVRNT